jgi:O-methyltransferase involved in polyketide biosynthesis
MKEINLYQIRTVMTEKVPQSLDGISKTLLMTLYARALESQRNNGMLHDEKAVEMVNRLDCDFSRLVMQRHDQIAVIMRMRKFDSHARNFMTRNPGAVVVHIGCGLDTRFERVDNHVVEWFDLDLPDVVELRQKLLHSHNNRYHMLAASVHEDAWMDVVERVKPRPVMFMAEGVLPYFTEDQVKSLVLKIFDRFAGAELVCDAHAPFVIWADNLQLLVSGVKARLHWGLKQASDLEMWADGIRLLDEWNYYEDREPGLRFFQWAGKIPAIARSSGIYHYRLGTALE